MLPKIKYSFVSVGIYIFLGANLFSCNMKLDDCENFEKRNGLIRKETVNETILVFYVKNCTYHGEFKEYYKNNKLKKKGSFKNGIKINQWYYYSIDGNLDSTLFYGK